jgi:hypothetical protein
MRKNFYRGAALGRTGYFRRKDAGQYAGFDCGHRGFSFAANEVFRLLADVCFFV